jgi:glycosyltransferase involved in cell wall biosynthesis
VPRSRILHVTQGTTGGTLEFLRLLLPRLDRERFEVEVACPSSGPMKTRLEELSIRVHEIAMEREISPLSDLRAYAELLKVIRSRRPDLLHLHSSKAGAIGRLAAFSCGVPSVYTPHGWSFGMEVSRRKKWMYATIERCAAALGDTIVNISDAESDLARRFRVAPDAKLTTIFNGIDPTPFQRTPNHDLRARLGIPVHAFVIGMTARLMPQKSPLTFVDVARLVAREVPNAYFLLVGDGEMRADVERRVRHANLDGRFLITGWKADVHEYISLFDVALLTSAWEGFGLVIAEYMAAKKPVVASRVGGIPNIIEHNRTGILVEAGDVAAFAKAIVALHVQTDLAAAVAERGHDTVTTRFHIDRVVSEHEDLYTKLIGPKDYDA